MHYLGKWLIIIGVLLVVAGVIIYFTGNKLQWFGNLPGDIRIKKDNFVFYAPITSMILVSIFISFIIWLLSKIKF